MIDLSYPWLEIFSKVNFIYPNRKFFFSNTRKLLETFELLTNCETRNMIVHHCITTILNYFIPFFHLFSPLCSYDPGNFRHGEVFQR